MRKTITIFLITILSVFTYLLIKQHIKTNNIKMVLTSLS